MGFHCRCEMQILPYFPVKVRYFDIVTALTTGKGVICLVEIGRSRNLRPGNVLKRMLVEIVPHPIYQRAPVSGQEQAQGDQSRGIICG